MKVATRKMNFNSTKTVATVYCGDRFTCMLGMHIS